MPRLIPRYPAQRPTAGIHRRRFLQQAASGTAALLFAQTGCVSMGPVGQPDLVWGRYGLSEGKFVKPRAITIDDQDQLYIVDTTGRIQVFDADGKWIRMWKTPLTENGRPTGLAFQSTADAADGIAKILVADTHYYRMLAYSIDGSLLQSPSIGGTAGSGPGQFAFVTDAISDHQGNYYVGEYNASDRIQKFDPEGNFVCQWGGTGHEPGKFVRPQSLVIDQSVLWVADSCNHRIQRFDLSADVPELIDIWGGPGEQPGEFFYPYDLAMDQDGTLIVVEYKNNRIQRLGKDGSPLAVWGSPGTAAGMLNQPWGIVVDSRRRVHVLDSNNHRVQRLFLPS